MTYKIRHETKLILMIPLVFVISMLLTLLLAYIDAPANALLISIAVCSISMAVSIILYFTEQLVGTRLTLDEGLLTIKHLLGRQTVALDEISRLDIEPYTRHRNPSRGAHYTEYRMRMRIGTGAGRDIVLTDKATLMNRLSGKFFGLSERMPDEDVPLYQAYLMISSMIS